MKIRTFDLTPDAMQRATAWLRLIDEHLALFDRASLGNRLRDMRADLIAHTTSDGLFNRWLGEMGEALRSEFRFAQGCYERRAEKAHNAAQAHAAAVSKAAREHAAAAKLAARTYAAQMREARA